MTILHPLRKIKAIFHVKSILFSEICLFLTRTNNWYNACINAVMYSKKLPINKNNCNILKCISKIGVNEKENQQIQYCIGNNYKLQYQEN